MGRTVPHSRHSRARTSDADVQETLRTRVSDVILRSIEDARLSFRYVTMCEQNKLGLVDVDLLRCLSCDLIPKLLIEKYLVEICRSQSVPFEPDQTIMAQDEFWTIGQRYVQSPTTATTTTTNDEKRPPPPSGGGRVDFPMVPSAQPSAPAVSDLNGYKPIESSLFQPQPQYPNINFGPSMPAPPPSANTPHIGFTLDRDVKAPFNDPFPQVPSANDRPVPPPAANGGGSDDPGFDDLARRFEDLKKRK